VIVCRPMPDDDRKLKTQEATDEGRTMTVKGGRTISVQDDVVELRAASGMLELRIKITEEGPVLQVEGVKVALRAAESVSVDCKTFEVRAEEGVKLHSDGQLDISSEKEMKVNSTDEIRVVGKMIHLN
jgi:phage gp45-like